MPKSVTEEHDHLEEMSREALIIHENMLFQLKPIGKGNFGQVYHGFLKYTPDSVPIEVAVKAIKVTDQVPHHQTFCFPFYT